MSAGARVVQLALSRGPSVIADVPVSRVSGLIPACRNESLQAGRSDRRNCSIPFFTNARFSHGEGDEVRDGSQGDQIEQHFFRERRALLIQRNLRMRTQ